MDYTVSSIQLLDGRFCHIFDPHHAYHLKEQALALACRVLCIVLHLVSSLLRESDPQMIQLGITYWQFQLGKCVHFFLVTISYCILTCVWVLFLIYYMGKLNYYAMCDWSPVSSEIRVTATQGPASPLRGSYVLIAASVTWVTREDKLKKWKIIYTNSG